MGWKQPIDTEIYEWFGNDHLARDLFIHLLLKARTEDMKVSEYYKNKPFKLKRGQVIFGRNEYAEKLRTSPMTTKHALDRLEKGSCRLASKSTPDYTVITILNYDELVGFEQANEQVISKQLASNEQVISTNKSVKIVKSVKSVKSVKKKDVAPKKGAKWKEVTPMDLKQFVDWCRKSTDAHVQIIGEWADELSQSFKFSGFETYGEWKKLFFDQNLKAARDLSPSWKQENGRARMSEATALLVSESKNGHWKTGNLSTLIKYMSKV